MRSKLPAIPRNRPIFLRANDQDADGGIASGDLVIGREPPILLRIESKTKISEIGASCRPHFWRIFANSSSENQSVYSVQDRSHCANVGNEAMDKYPEGKLGAPVAFLHGG